VIDALSIVVPAFNEASNIEATVADALRVGATVTSSLEVVVCDDGSADATGAILDRLAGSEPRLRVLHRRGNRGIEASIRALYARARHGWIFLNSADRQWPMEALLPMVEAAAAGADLVLGVRRNKRDVYTTYRQVLSWSYEQIVRALGAPIGDPGTIKLGRRALLDAPVVAAGVFAEGERIIRAARGGARVVEVPVDFQRRRAGKATGARRDVVARAALDSARVASSLLVGWPRPARPQPDVDDAERTHE
jgi:glycosyltransferase involved in cell wall biosynthesis